MKPHTDLPERVALALEFLRLVKDGHGRVDRWWKAEDGVYMSQLSPAGELARDAAYDVLEAHFRGRTDSSELRVASSDLKPPKRVAPGDDTVPTP